MKGQLAEVEFRQRVILAELSRGPQRRNDLLGRALAKGLSPQVFNVTFRHLASCGRIQKQDDAKRAPWVITLKGAKLLEALA